METADISQFRVQNVACIFYAVELVNDFCMVVNYVIQGLTRAFLTRLARDSDVENCCAMRAIEIQFVD